MDKQIDDQIYRQINKGGEINRRREIDRQTERQIDGEIDRQRD